MIGLTNQGSPSNSVLKWPGADSFARFEKEIETAFRIRLTEDRLLELFKEGRLFGTVHTCVGQEFVGIAVARALGPSDTIFSNHRCHGHFLAYCSNLVGLIGEVMGKSVGVCRGRGGSQHLHCGNFFSNGVQGGIVPVAVGLGFGHKLSQSGGVSVVFIGDGTLGEGVVYESLNLAAKWNLPVLFVCENNLYAQSTPQNQTLAGRITDRARAFGIRTKCNSTWDWEALFEGMSAGIRSIRETGTPLFYQVDTYRLRAHSKGDDNRPSEEIVAYLEKDPLKQIEEKFACDPNFSQMLRRLRQEINEAVDQAENAPYSELEEPKVDPLPPDFQLWEERDFPVERMSVSICRGLGEILEERPEVVLIGEDIESPYGGAFKCTIGLSDRFPGRVLNTPISEAAVVGLANGVALSGRLPIVEIMFGDFLTLIMDQWVNHAAKFEWMYDGQVKVPLIIRTPMGGRRGYGPTHSQSLEKHFIGLPGTQVLCLHHRYSGRQLYGDLTAGIDRPTLVIEWKALYGVNISSEAPDGFRLFYTKEQFPTANLAPCGRPEITILAGGGMSLEAEAAVLRLFDEAEVAADLFLPTRLYPFDISVLGRSLEQTGRLLLLEEGQGFASWSSEILAQVMEKYGSRGLVCKRLSAKPVPIASARTMESLCLPDRDAVVSAALHLIDHVNG